jgi:hypothetical protein
MSIGAYHLGFVYILYEYLNQITTQLQIYIFLFILTTLRSVERCLALPNCKSPKRMRGKTNQKASARSSATPPPQPLQRRGSFPLWGN